jgi:hypothetical protein
MEAWFEAFALPVLFADARLSSAVVRRSFRSTRAVAAALSPFAGVGVLWMHPRKLGVAGVLLNVPLASARFVFVP